MNGEPIKVGAIHTARARIVLEHAGGLHARPAIKLTQLAKRFSCSVWLALDEQGPWTDAKSIARVMAMKTPQAATLHFMAEGDDAEAAVRSLAKLVAQDFPDGSDDG
jgi:phosphocarrier protein HPr